MKLVENVIPQRSNGRLSLALDRSQNGFSGIDHETSKQTLDGRRIRIRQYSKKRIRLHEDLELRVQKIESGERRTGRKEKAPDFNKDDRSHPLSALFSKPTTYK